MRRVHFEMDCVTVYHRIESTMFEDGIVNAGRLYVLYVFTQTYCAQYTDRACDIWTAYNRVVEGLRCVVFHRQPISSQEIRSRHFWSISQSEARKKNQSEAGFKKKQPIDSINTKYSFYEKQRQESRDSHFIRHVT